MPEGGLTPGFGLTFKRRLAIIRMLRRIRLEA
jgi:hypothetical protein